MNLKQSIVYLLCISIVLGMMSGLPVFAEENLFDTIEDVLGVEMISSLNAWDFSNSTITTYTRAGYHSIQTPDGATFTSDGLDLRGTNGVDSWRFSAFRSWSPLSINLSSFRAVYFKVKGDVSAVVKTPDNYSIVKLDSAPGVSLSSMTTSTGATAVREVTHDLTVDNNWVEYLMVPRNTNAVYLWAKSSTLTGGKWVKVMGLDRYYYTTSSAEDYQTNRENGINFSGTGTVALWKTIDFNLGEENVFQQDARTVVLSDEETRPEGADCLWFEEEFLKEPGYPNHSFGDAVHITGDGVAQTPVKYANSTEGISATSGRLTFYDLEIPVDGYAEFKMKSNSLKGFSFDDGTEKYEVNLNCDYSSIPGTVSLAGGYVADSDASWRTWRVVRSANGYSLYSQIEGDSGWRIHAMDGFSGETAGNGEKISLVFYGNCDGASDGNGKLDYLKIYGPAPEKALVMTDGYSTKVVDSKAELSSPDAAYLLAMRSPEVERKLIFAKYGVENLLLDTEVVTVPKGTGAISVPYDLSDEDGSVREFKVFLWDGFNLISPASPNYVEKGDLTLWTDAWEFSGNSNGESGAIVLNSKAENTAHPESYAEWSTKIADACDISWTMEVEKFNGSESVEVYTGKHNISLGISGGEITYLTNSGKETTPWAIGNGMHQYQLLHKDGTCHLMIDGYHVAELTDIKDSSESSKIRFQNHWDETEDSNMRIESVHVGTYAEENLPSLTEKSFYHDFEFTGEATTGEAQYERLHSLGWEPNKRTVEVDGEKVNTPYEDDGSLVTAWEIDEGNLQIGGFRTRKTNSTVQKYFKQNIGDDYVFLTRMQIPQFGTTGQINLYLKNRVLSMNLKQMFFGMRTAASSLAGLSAGVDVAYSDPLMIDPEKWYDLRIETYDYCKYARIYLDDVKIMEAELFQYDEAYYAFNITSQSDTTTPFEMKFDYIKCAPINYDVVINGLADGAVYPEGGNISLSATVEGSKEGSVQYVMNGKVVATGLGSNHDATLSGLPAGSYEIKAVCGNKFSAPVMFTVEKASSSDTPNKVDASSNYANEVYYTATGDGQVEFGNGLHLLKLSHQGGQLQYETDTGIQTYAEGLGKFHIMTEGPVAEVYRNGQFAFSYFMPMSGEVKQSFTGIAEGTVVASPERKTYFSGNNVADKKQVYKLNGLSYGHVLDFVAGSRDEFQLVLNDGYYRTTVSAEDGELYIWGGKRNNSLVEKTKIATLGTEDDHYRVETSGGMSRLYKNGRWITTFRGAPTVGEAILSVNVTSGVLAYLGVCDNTDVYLYQDDFSGMGDLDSVDYWMTSGDMDLTVDSKNERLSMVSTGTNGIAELSPACGNASLSADVNVVSGDGFWFLVNHAVDHTYTKVGYNFKTGKYEIVDVIKTAKSLSDGSIDETITETIVKEASGTFSKNAAASMKVEVVESNQGKTVALTVDGRLVISGITSLNCRGNVGFMVANGSTFLDDVAYRGDAKPMVGVTEYTHEGNKMMDLIENFETGEVYLLASNAKGFATSDGGKTWSDVSLANPTSNNFYQFYQDVTLDDGTEFYRGDIIAVSKNGNGRIPQDPFNPSSEKIYMVDEYGQAVYDNYAKMSTDYGKSWFVISRYFNNLVDAKHEGSTVNALKRGASGRFYYVNNTGGNEDYGGAVVWYSDDASTWTKSETTILSKEIGFVIAEAEVIETSKSTRLYFRNDLGSICYFTSPDRGKTWDLTPHKTPFISVASCFNVEIDPMDEDTLYIAWIYDNGNLFARHQFPRMRWGVAKSTDAGETWEMIGTAHENTSVYHENSNMNIMVSSEHVFVSADSANQYGTTSPNGTRIVAFPKEGQKTTKRFEQLHLQYPTQVENTRVMPEHLTQSALVIQPKTFAGWIHGRRIENAVYNDYVSVDCAASLVGATVEYNAGTIVFKIGNTEVKFHPVSLLNRNDVWYVRLSAFVEEFNLSVVEEDDIKIISENKDWSLRQKKAFRYAVDVFSSNP